MLRLSLVRWILAVVLLGVQGCASGYRRYDDCRVPCRYCVPNPLAYENYCPPPCHSHAAAPYVLTSVASADLPAPVVEPETIALPQP